MSIVNEIKCSHCGAPIPFQPGEIVATCKYCGYTVVIETGKAFTFEHSMLLNRYDQTQIEEPIKEWMREGCDMMISIRPEKIFISKKEVKNFSNTLKGTVQSIVYHGRSTQYNILLKNNMRLQVFEQNEEHFQQEVIDYDNEVNLYWQKENVVILEK